MKLDVNNISTHYQIIGQKKSTLVMLHGWGCDWQIFSPVIALLSANFKLIIPDLPCFGQSECPSQTWDSHDYVEWLQAFLKKVAPGEKVSLLGHSFGGKIVSLYAAQKPALVKKLIIVDASGLPDPLSGKQRLIQGLAALVPETAKSLVPLTVRRQLLNRVGAATDHLQSSPRQKKILRKIVRENIGSQLVKIKAPTLLIWGQNDYETPLHQGKHFHHLIDQAQLEVFTAAGHFPFVDQPQKFVQVVTKFLR